MKIRNGFVSNSSSSSFMCDVSGEIESGWDASLDDVGMVQCENGHTFSEQFALPGWSEATDGDRYGVPGKFCPLCSLAKFKDEDLLAYLLKSRGVAREALEAEIRGRFADHAALRDFLKA